jgi:hypothetical protein
VLLKAVNIIFCKTISGFVHFICSIPYSRF